MAATIVPAAFKNCGEAGRVSVHIREGIDEQIPTPSLSREVNHIRKAVLFE
jgi:hypothetical protein